ncbi:MAG: thiamine pyrophosphate-dependent enzyme [Candidatus Heimdallarchaeaceae archaeon]
MLELPSISVKNLQEWSKLDAVLTSGHRLCAGCGAGIMARQVTIAAKALGDPIMIVNATGCLEVATTIYPYTAWNAPWLHNAFENAPATASGAIEAMKVMRRKQNKPDRNVNMIIFGGDGATYDIGLQSLSGAIERGHDFLYVCYNNGAYMNCLSLDTHILTKDGLKRVLDVKLGEEVYAFNQETRELVLKKCSGIFNNGIKEVYELKTLHHSIKTTMNHPYLTVQRSRNKEENTLVWKTLENLKSGDEIVVLKNLNEGQSFTFKEIKISKKGDYKVHKINEIRIPEKSNPDLMEFFGLFLGDGWVRPHKAETGFSLPKDSDTRARLVSLSKKLFNLEPSTVSKNDVYLYSVNLARFIESLNFGQGAKNKKVPSWIFTLPQEEKEAFVKGLMQSDGYIIDRSNRYVSASIELLKTLRLLLQTMNYRVGKIHQQTKKKGTFVVYRQLLEDSTYGYICFSKKKGSNVDKYPSQTKQRDFFAENTNFSSEKIISIEFVKEEPTIDFRIEGEHNFIADGIVVHNTGIQRSGGTPQCAATTTSPPGKIIPGKIKWAKPLAEIMAAHEIPSFTASPAYVRDLMAKVQAGLKHDGSAFLLVDSPCNLGQRYAPDISIETTKIAVKSCFFPLYGTYLGEWVLTGESARIAKNPDRKVPVEDYLKLQGRFKHLFKPEWKKKLIEIQETVDERWERLVSLTSC